MSDRRLLVVYKKSQLELYQEHEPEAIEYLRAREPQLLARFEHAHKLNSQAIDKVGSAATKLGFDAECVYRADHEAGNLFSLVISVGGDGTLLDVSQTLRDVPIMGVNSSPTMSVGHFCCTDADGFATALEQWRDGQLESAVLNRLQITVNGTPNPTPVLNEMLYAHTVPGAVSRYVFRCGDAEEEHKSSGIWISTAAGSTAAILSAGGHIMDAEDPRLQFVVREPYKRAAEYKLLRGTTDNELEILSKMRTAALYLDGHRHQIELRLGDRVIVGSHPNPLKLVGFKGHVS